MVLKKCICGLKWTFACVCACLCACLCVCARVCVRARVCVGITLQNGPDIHFEDSTYSGTHNYTENNFARVRWYRNNGQRVIESVNSMIHYPATIYRVIPDIRLFWPDIEAVSALITVQNGRRSGIIY